MDMEIISVNRSSGHTMIKPPVDSIQIVAGIGIEGDAHSGEKVKHVWDKKRNPDKLNLRQVHLIHSELFEELKDSHGFSISPGEMGENITTKGIPLLDLPRNTILHIGNDVQLKVTGLRMPCSQLEPIQKGLMKAVMPKDEQGDLILKTGIFSIAIQSGEIKPGDSIRIEYPEKPFLGLQAV
jgi:MOSC domain-containing protein YiiM